MGLLTQERPKCLLPIGDSSILERIFKRLAQVGISEAVLVVGYKSEQIEDSFGSQFKGINLKYILNDRYDESSTAYSLWLARSYLDRECLILEGDLIFDAEALQRVLSQSPTSSTWAAIPLAPGFDEGILLDQDEHGRIAEVGHVPSPQEINNEYSFKCAGIQLLISAASRIFRDELDMTIRKGDHKILADLVLGRLLNKTPIQLCSLQGLRWFEVDSQEEYKEALKLFALTENEILDE